MRIGIIFYTSIFLAMLFSVNLYADSWSAPTEKDYFSENQKFVSHVTPSSEKNGCWMYTTPVKDKNGNPVKDEATAKREKTPLLEMYEVNNSERKLIWQCDLSNKYAPVHVFTSDEGKYAVTNDEWGSIGYGDCVIAFYNSNGLIKQLSVMDILHLPKKTDDRKLYKLIPHSVSSRYWHEKGFRFLDNFEDKVYFCFWSGLSLKWQAWDAASGREITPTEKMLEKWNKKGRSLALKQLNRMNPGDGPYEFLGKLKHPEDRRIIERLFNSRLERRKNISLRNMKEVDINAEGYNVKIEPFRFTVYSPKRIMAERILAEWDGKTIKKSDPSEWQYYYLGTVKGTVKLPRKPKQKIYESDLERDNFLYIYLVPDTNLKAKWWNNRRIIQRLAASLNRHTSDNYENTEDFHFCFEGVTPGKYRVKTVWGKGKPFHYYAGKSTNIGTPVEGDYENQELPVIEVKAGQTADNIVVECIHLISGN